MRSFDIAFKLESRSRKKGRGYQGYKIVSCYCQNIQLDRKVPKAVCGSNKASKFTQE